jgi:hypothetical protein
VNNIPKKKEIVKIKDFTPKFHTLTELAEHSEKEINKFNKKNFSVSSVGSVRNKFLVAALPRCVLCGLCEI